MIITFNPIFSQQQNIVPPRIKMPEERQIQQAVRINSRKMTFFRLKIWRLLMVAIS